MKIKFLILLSIFSLQLAISQNYQTVEEVNEACATLGFSGDEDAQIAVDAILDKMGLYRNFVIQECPDINNAVAKNIDMGSGEKERYILYDSEFFKRIDVNAGNDWAATSVLAHEIGHHLNGHALNNKGSSHKWELEADEFSGFVLARMEATLEDAQSAIQTLKYEKATRTHPAKADRLLAIEKGYNRGLGKTIVVKKIDDEIIKDITENNEDGYIGGDGITAEQVFSKYIDDIGGEEKVRNIKTFIKQKTVSSSKTLTDGKKRESTFQVSKTFLTPNSFINESSRENNNNRTLWIDGINYEKNDIGLWKKGNGQIFGQKLVSYIPEYSLLLSKKEVAFLGIKTIEGISCFVIEMPKKVSTGNTDRYNRKSTLSYTKYFSIDSGLLAFQKITSITDWHWIKDTERDSKSTLQTMISYVDYRLVKGVLFPFKTKGKTIDSKNKSHTIINKFTDIQVNPILNKEDFKVND